MTRDAAMARHKATAMSPMGPRPKIATVFPGTFASVTVYTALPSGSCIVASSGGRSGSLIITFVAGTVRYSAKDPARSIPRMETVLHTCAFTVRHMSHRPHAMTPSAVTYAPRAGPGAPHPGLSLGQEHS